MAVTAQKIRSRGRRKGNILAAVLTLILTAVVLVSGFLAAALMERWMPSYLQTQVVTDKAAAVGPILGGGDITQYLFPWNIYDEDKVVKMEDEDQSIVQQLMQPETLFLGLMRVNDEDLSGFWSRIEVMQDDYKRYYYLRDWEISTPDGQPWRIDCALSADATPGLLYLKVQPVRTQAPSREQIHQTYSKLLNAAELLKDVRLSESGEKEAPILFEKMASDEMEKTLARYWDYLNQMADLLQTADAMAPYEVFSQLRASNGTVLADAEILRTDTEVMVIYTVFEMRLILFVDPLTEEYIGFCLQY